MAVLRDYWGGTVRGIVNRGGRRDRVLAFRGGVGTPVTEQSGDGAKTRPISSHVKKPKTRRMSSNGKQVTPGWLKIRMNSTHQSVWFWLQYRVWMAVFQKLPSCSGAMHGAVRLVQRRKTLARHCSSVAPQKGYIMQNV